MSDKSGMAVLVPHFFLLLAFLCLSQAAAGVMPGNGLQTVTGQPQWREQFGTGHSQPGRIEWIAAAQGQGGDETGPKPPVMPEENEAEKDKGKTCMTVCIRWGEECMIDSVRGVRKCRRTCKEFGEECF